MTLAELFIDVNNNYICVGWGSDMNVFMGWIYVIRPLVAILTCLRPYECAFGSR